MVMFLKPNPERKVNGEPLKVFDPERKGWLPAEGYAVPSNEYWVRRIADGDCVEYDPQAVVVDEPVDPKEAKRKEKAAEKESKAAAKKAADKAKAEADEAQKLVEKMIDEICEALGASDFVMVDTPEGEDQVMALLDAAGAVIAQGTLTQLQDIADADKKGE